MKQQRLFKDDNKSFGGDLFTKRKGRGVRPLDTRNTMHLVLRSTQAKGAKSFTKHRYTVHEILHRFVDKFGLKLHSFANVGNHIHVHLKLGHRLNWRKFIRAVTAAIAVKIGGKSRWGARTKSFWDRRPFTRIVVGWRAFKTLAQYIRINEYEGHGVKREQAREMDGA